MQDHLLVDIGKSILGAAVVGFPAYYLRLPLLLAYIMAGVLLGPHLGFGFIQSSESIATLSEIGLVLLMFILGLEIDIRKLMQAGKAVLLNGLIQFIGCALLAVGFFSLTGLSAGVGPHGLVYLAVACSLSSTLIVVKVLSDRLELGTVTSRITLGILVIQDLWAIGFLAIQPDLQNLNASALLMSGAKAFALVMVSWLLAKFALPRIFAKAGKQPELMLITAMAWCFTICGFAEFMHLSLEMGALIAGVSIAAFPYHVDVAAKVSSLRDFFITLFFVALGLQIPSPTWNVIILALSIIGFVLVSRALTVFPVLYKLNYGNRASLIPALNLSQLSEFALVLAALGVTYNHVTPDLLSAFVLAMVTTALISSFVIPSGHSIFRLLNPLLEKVGFKDSGSLEEKVESKESAHYDFVLLGFFHEASSLLQELINRHSSSVLSKLLVVDFNPEAHQRLKDMGIHCKYGDIGHQETLRHLELHHAKLLICTVPDHILKGTTNLKLLKQLQALAPDAKIIVTAESLQSAREMYAAGATYVFVPRLISAYYLADVLQKFQTEAGISFRENAIKHLEKWHEVLP